MSLTDRIKDAKHWTHRARLRFLGARHNLREARAEIEDIQKRLPHAQGGVKEELQDRLKEQQRRKQKLQYQVKHRFKVWRHTHKKLRHLRKIKDERRKDDETPAGGNCGFSVPSRGWNPYGRAIPNWMIPWLDKTAQLISFTVVSGVRTSAQSVGLCMNMCGHPTCSGTCAGAGSNHNFDANECYPNGALDVTNQYAFESAQYKIGSPLRNDLPADSVHFSVSGH